jgi:hypothetical protein
MIKTLAALVAVFSINLSAYGDDYHEESLASFLGVYQCPLAGILARIHAHSLVTKHGRFIALELPQRGGLYVQCLFEQSDRSVDCEAASGFYDKPNHAPYFVPSQIEGLAQLGFSTDGTHGNYSRIHVTAEAFSPDEVAALMLKALFVGYGARKESEIDVVAPFAMPHGVLPRRRCILTS